MNAEEVKGFIEKIGKDIHNKKFKQLAGVVVWLN